jgi:hypothetical protein
VATTAHIVDGQGGSVSYAGLSFAGTSLHGLDDPRYPSLVGFLIVNTNLPIPSSWSRRRVQVEPVTGRDNPEG